MNWVLVDDNNIRQIQERVAKFKTASIFKTISVISIHWKTH